LTRTYYRAIRDVGLLLSLTLLVGCTTPSSIEPADLKPFATDGCSRFPDGTSEDRMLWCHCCAKHDYAYWMGGTSEQRKAADQELKECVAAAGKPKTGAFMGIGVRAGGSPLWPTRFRWGYGWPYYHGYKPLSEDEKRKVESLSQTYDELSAEICSAESR
jgi:hypothetical protein